MKHFMIDDRTPVSTSISGGDIPDGQIFTGSIPRSPDRLFVKRYGGPHTTEIIGIGPESSHSSTWGSGVTIDNYRPVKRITFTIEE